jgi:hypothetical protein
LEPASLHQRRDVRWTAARNSTRVVHPATRPDMVKHVERVTSHPKIVEDYPRRKAA